MTRATLEPALNLTAPATPRVMRNPCIHWVKDRSTLPRITIVTACLNHADYLEAALLSVLEQGYPNLEYIVLDGGSSDGSAKIIERYAPYLHYWTSSPDEGMYFAIQRGFEMSRGEIMAWLNADDMLQRNGLWTVAEIFQQLPRVEWIMGWPLLYDDCGRAYMPHCRMRWSRMRFLRGDYRFIQQESVFWRRRLWERAGAALDTRYRLAADMELWMRFFRHTPLHTAEVPLAGFRKRPESLSQRHLEGYLEEAERILANEPRTPEDLAGLRRFRWFDRLWLRLPGVRKSWRVRRALGRLLNFPPLIVYNDQTRRYELQERPA